MGRQMNGWMAGWTDGWKDGWIGVVHNYVERLSWVFFLQHGGRGVKLKIN